MCAMQGDALGLRSVLETGTCPQLILGNLSRYRVKGSP